MSRRWTHPVSKAVFVVMITAASIHAGVIYNFVGTGTSGMNAAFQLTVPDFINPPLTGGVGFLCDQLDWSTDCGSAVAFEHQAIYDNGVVIYVFDLLVFGATNPNLNASYNQFLSGAFTTPGQYSAAPPVSACNCWQAATLTVTTTPEPSAILLVLSGIGYSLLAGRTLRDRRLRRRAKTRRAI